MEVVAMDGERVLAELHQAVAAVVGEYAASAVLTHLAPGEMRALLVVRQAELFTSDGRTGVLPAQGDVVAVHSAGSWQLLVERAAFGRGRVVLVGAQGGGAVPEWTVYEKAELLQTFVAPGERQGDVVTEQEARIAGGVWQNTWPAHGAGWAEMPEAMMRGLAAHRLQPMVVASSDDFARLYGVAPAYKPLSVRTGGWRKRFRWWRLKRRERVALKLAPWLHTEDARVEHIDGSVTLIDFKTEADRGEGRG